MSAADATLEGHSTNGQRIPVVSVIVPVYQGGAVLTRCLDALLTSDLPRESWELVIVDDGSTDDSARIAARADTTLRIEDGPRGPACARNRGARVARAPLLCFVDADVAVASHTLRGLVDRITADHRLAAVFGAYDADPAERGTVTEYRNLLHHFVHRSHAGDAATFWAGCGIVRRDAFDAAGGFDEARYHRPQIEDIDLGYRLRDAGGRILLDPSLTGEHLKRWTVMGMLRTDLLDRAVPWTRLLLDRREVLNHTPLNLATRQKSLVGLIALMWLMFPLALLLHPAAAVGVVATALLVTAVGNADLFAFLARTRGWPFAARCVPLHLLHHTVSALGAGWAIVSCPPEAAPARRWPLAAIGAALLLLALHAWLAWSMRSPTITTGGNDASYLALARALHEGSYRELWTSGTPIHSMYPPGYPALLAVVGATSLEHLPLALVVNVLASVLALLLTALLAGRLSPWMGVAALLILAPNPALVDAAGRAKSEPLFTVLLLATLIALRPTTSSKSRLAFAGACAIAAALTRSIGIAVVGAVLLEWALEGRWRAAVALAVASALTVGAWFTWTVMAPDLPAGSSYIADAVLVAPSAPAPTDDGRTRGGGPASGAGSPTPPLIAVLARRAAVNVPEYLTQAVPVALAQPTIPGTPIDNLVGVFALLVVGVAGSAVVLRRQRAIMLVLALYAAVLAVWPYIFVRFLVPVLPLLVLLLLAGVAHLRGVSATAFRAAMAQGAVAILLAVATIGPNLARLRQTARCDRSAEATRAIGCVSEHQRDYFAAIDALDSLAPKTTGFLTAKASTAYLFSGRTSARQSTALALRDPERLLTWLREQDVEVILLSHLHIEQWGLSPMLQARCESFGLVREYPTHALLLRLLPADSPASSGGANERACAAIARWAGVDWQAEFEQARIGIW